jgi:7,8-dihydroneopterin aldolase/epimerase/oxygenase
MNGDIQLNGMAFYGYHGHLPEEKSLGQRFVIDLTLTADITEAAQTDALAATVDYTAVFALCRKIVEGDRHRLLESLAARVLQGVLDGFPRVTRAHIVIRKPGAPIAGVFDHVSLETSLERR